MKWMLLLILGMQLGLVSCSGNKKKTDVDSTIENVDDEVVLIEEDDLMGDPTEDIVLTEESSSIEGINEDLAETEVSAIQTNDSGMNEGGMGEYITQKNDTLMIIAWKMYGDYTKWRNLLEWNSDKISSVSSLGVGVRLKYKYPNSPFNWSPNGDPYLIQRGDTLGKISHNVYSASKYWKKLYLNNKPLIRDPNLIFAGFTIYYEQLNRNTASGN